MNNIILLKDKPSKWNCQNLLIHPGLSHKNVRRAWFKERFTINKIWTKASNIHKTKLRELHDTKLSDLHPFDNMAIIHCVKNELKTER